MPKILLLIPYFILRAAPLLSRGLASPVPQVFLARALNGAKDFCWVYSEFF
jgi:hypothetical protein